MGLEIVLCNVKVHERKVEFLRLMGFLRFYFSAVPSCSMMKFEGGYMVEMVVFNGSKLGIEPYSVDISPRGELLVLDSENSNIYKISTPLSRCKLFLARTV
jgi:hypothetical protein